MIAYIADKHVGGWPTEDTVKGHWCPLPTLACLKQRLKNGKYALTIHGLAKKCPGCDTFWFADTEYFFASKTQRDGLMSSCKACYAESRREHGDAHLEEEHLPDLSPSGEQLTFIGELLAA